MKNKKTDKTFPKKKPTVLTSGELERLGLNEAEVITKDQLKGYREIGESCFEYNPHLTSIELPNSIKTIGNDAFRKCSNLSHVILSNKLKKIGYSAFEGCVFKSITIPASVEIIDNYAFSGCILLEKVVFEQYDGEIGENGLELRYSSFSSCWHLNEFFIPYHIKKLGGEVFGDDPNLKTVNFLTNRLPRVESPNLFSGSTKLKRAVCWDEEVKKWMDRIKQWDGGDYDVWFGSIVGKDGGVIPSDEILKDPVKYGILK